MKKRSIQIEQLDELSLDGPRLTKALDSLAWVNRWLGNHSILSFSVLKVIDQHPEQKHFHIIDLGCGGGDVLRTLGVALHKKNIAFSLLGMDGNPNTLEYARNHKDHLSEIKYQQADILDSNFVLPACDILISSHFIYHFSSNELQQFLEKNLRQVHLSFINSGLERSAWALRLFKYFSVFLPLSRLAKADGQLAIQSAFTKDELNQIIRKLPFNNISLRRLPFFRLQLILSTQAKKSIR